MHLVFMAVSYYDLDTMIYILIILVLVVAILVFGWKQDSGVATREARYLSPKLHGDDYQKIEACIDALGVVEDPGVDYDNDEIRVYYEDAKISEPTIQSALKQAGFDVRLLSDAAVHEGSDE